MSGQFLCSSPEDVMLFGASTKEKQIKLADTGEFSK
jgi:hypothetical protein